MPETQPMQDNQPQTFHEWIATWLEQSRNVLVRTKQDGKMAHVPLSQVQNQRLVVQVFQDGLRAYVAGLPKMGTGRKALDPEAADQVMATITG